MLTSIISGVSISETSFMTYIIFICTRESSLCFLSTERPHLLIYDFNHDVVVIAVIFRNDLVFQDPDFEGSSIYNSSPKVTFFKLMTER